MPWLNQYLGVLLRRGEHFEGASNSFDTDFTCDESVAIDFAFSQVTQRGLEFVPGVAQHELNRKLLVSSQHRFKLVALHADSHDDQSRIGRCTGHHGINHTRHADALENHRWPPCWPWQPGWQLWCLGWIAIGRHLLPAVVG